MLKKSKNESFKKFEAKRLEATDAKNIKGGGFQWNAESFQHFVDFVTCTLPAIARGQNND